MSYRSNWLVAVVAAGTLGACSSPEPARQDRVVASNRSHFAAPETEADNDSMPVVTEAIDQDAATTDDLYVRPAVIPAEMKGMIEAEERENENCRGGAGDQTETMKACNRRQALLKNLEDAGLCWGGASIGADMHWIRCKDDRTHVPGHYDEPYYNEAEINEVTNGS